MCCLHLQTICKQFANILPKTGQKAVFFVGISVGTKIKKPVKC
jgi:hypothetical protein